MLVRWTLGTVVAAGLTLVAPTAVQADAALDARFSDYVSVTNKVFYPRVKDGFKDTVDVAIDNVIDFGDVRATVTNSSGTPVRQLRSQTICGALSNDEDCYWDTGRVRWNGKTTSGKTAPKGAYTITLTGTSHDEVDGDWVEVPVTTSRRVTLDSGKMTRNFEISREGTKTTTRVKGRGCYFDSNETDLEVACWRGTSAKATWAFKVPANATKTRALFFGDEGYNHGGKMRLSGKRTSKTRFVAAFEVTNWRSEWVYTVVVKYRARVKV